LDYGSGDRAFAKSNLLSSYLKYKAQLALAPADSTVPKPPREILQELVQLAPDDSQRPLKLQLLSTSLQDIAEIEELVESGVLSSLTPFVFSTSRTVSRCSSKRRCFFSRGFW
jgi:hypothetical protein